LLEKYKLKKGEDTHQLTYNKVCYWERKLKADAVFIDQGEGTALYTLATNAGKTHWILISFASNPTDHVDSSQSEYKNIRAMMYYKTQESLMMGGVLDARLPEWIDDIRKQLCWTKGKRHKVTHQKLAEDKKELKDRVGQSPDVADGCVLLEAYEVIDKLPENESSNDGSAVGGKPMRMHTLTAAETYGEFDNDDLYD
jgi:hypothetical protein